jgi:hypothetical protein
MGAVLRPDTLWGLIEPLLPTPLPKPRGGRPRRTDRAGLSGYYFCAPKRYSQGDAAEKIGLRFASARNAKSERVVEDDARAARMQGSALLAILGTERALFQFEANPLAGVCGGLSSVVSAQEFDVIPATRVYAASVLSGEPAVSGEIPSSSAEISNVVGRLNAPKPTIDENLQAGMFILEPGIYCLL